jgi:hypothetical protein
VFHEHPNKSVLACRLHEPHRQFLLLTDGNCAGGFRLFVEAEHVAQRKARKNIAIVDYKIIGMEETTGSEYTAARIVIHWGGRVLDRRTKNVRELDLKSGRRADDDVMYSVRTEVVNNMVDYSLVVNK